MKYLVDFETLQWHEPARGVRYKAVIKGNQQVRLVEFSHGFVEGDWCMKGHAGYVISGTFANDYSGEIEYYKAGDIIFIPGGETAKHKAILAEGEKVTLLLFEVLQTG